MSGASEISLVSRRPTKLTCLVTCLVWEEVGGGGGGEERILGYWMFPFSQ